MRTLILILCLTACDEPEIVCEPEPACLALPDDGAIEACLIQYDYAVTDAMYGRSWGQKGVGDDHAAIGYRSGREAYDRGEACPTWLHGYSR